MSSLISLNLTNFYSISYSYNISGMFSNCNKNLKYCINDKIFYNDKFIDELKTFQKNCSDICITMNYKKYIMEKYLCIDNCNLDSEYKYDYNNICYKKCPKEGECNKPNNNNNQEEKSSESKKPYGLIIAGCVGLIIIIIVSIFIFKKIKKFVLEKKSKLFFKKDMI